MIDLHDSTWERLFAAGLLKTSERRPYDKTGG